MDFLLERFATAPDRVAFIDDDRAVTYGQVLAKVDTYSAWLKDKGVERGAIVAVLGDYAPELFCFLLALVKNKNTLVPLTAESVVEKDTVLAISEAGYFVQFNADLDRMALERLGTKVTTPLLVDFLKGGDPGLILFSSGSSGKPKGILHNFRLVAEKFREARRATITITFLMLDHFGGINTLLAITSSLGTVVTVKTRSVSAICETIQKHKVETLPTTPSFLNMLVSSGSQKRYDLSSLKLITYGTEVMPQNTLDRLRGIFAGVKLQQTYGLSELGVLRSQSREDGSLWVRVGGEGFETKVVDGILWIRSRFAMVGYLNAPSPFDAEGWFNTQDRVEVDGEYFRILGRVTDLMNIGGQKVYPAEIEDI
ncbi:MAG: AMP-binding protein, partial [Archangium sp.]|nr:AMP-binding protein [Archangium sp.]